MQHTDFTVLLPIIVTLVFALLTRNVVIGLFLGVLTGVCMLNTFSPISSVGLLVKDYLVPQLSSNYNAGVLILLVFIGGFVALMEKSGGGQAFAERVTFWINSKCRAQISAWIAGIIIFFSDLGTPLIIGPIFRPLFKKLVISREKLAFILDSTSSPVAILIPFIGWGVYIMGLLQKELDRLDLEISDWQAFIHAIPYQFYAFLAIFIVPLIAIKKLDFGPMLVAEKRVKKEENSKISQKSLSSFTHSNAKPSFVILPLLVMGVVFISMLGPLGFPFEKISGADFRAALTSAYFFSAMSLIGLMTFYKVRHISESISIYLEGMTKMMPIAIILVLAWALSSVGHELGTAAYIAEKAQSGFPGWLVPAIAFLLSAIISFATGSSWGTFAIMFPLVIPTAVAIDAPLYVCIGAVLSGGLFGDHSSPLSDTTILSSAGASCDPFEHFRTQFPYALLNGCIALVCFIIAGIVNTPIVLGGALIMQIVIVYILSKRQAKKNI